MAGTMGGHVECDTIYGEYLLSLVTHCNMQTDIHIIIRSCRYPSQNVEVPVY